MCRLTIRIGGMDYRLRPCPPEPGLLAAWVLRKLDHDSARYLVTSPKGKPAHCTCPDHERSGWTCKHIGALTAAGLIPAPKPASARGRKLHAKNAHQAIAEAQAIPVEARRHLAEIAPPAQALPEGWQPGGMHPSYQAGAADFAQGFGAAVRSHIAARRAEGKPIAEHLAAMQAAGIDPDFMICHLCGDLFPAERGRVCDVCSECEGGIA
jgi:hypothetical protein